MITWRPLGLLILVVSLFAWAALAQGQSTARGEITSYNPTNATAILALNSSDLRYNRIPLEGGIVSIGVNDTTAQAFLLPADAPQVDDDLVNAIRLTGFDPAQENIDLVLLVGRQTSALRHLDGTSDPLARLGAEIEGIVRVAALAPPPEASPRTIETEVLFAQDDGDPLLALRPQDTDARGLFQAMSGTLSLNGQERSFRLIDDYFATFPHADVYLLPEETEAGLFWQIVPPPANRAVQNLAVEFGLGPGTPISLRYEGYDYADSAAGRITELQDNGQQLLTDVPADYLDQIGVPVGGYAVFAVGGGVRAALVMDEAMFAAAFSGGLSSNYVLLRQTGILKIVYLQDDGRVVQTLLAAAPGDPVRIRPAQAVETIVRPEAVVKAISEIPAAGFIYTDITALELSFLEVLVGQYVDVNINGISYRARVVDAELLAAPPESHDADILVQPNRTHTILTHLPGDSLTAEARFQASPGDVVVIQRAPN